MKYFRALSLGCLLTFSFPTFSQTSFFNKFVLLSDSASYSSKTNTLREGAQKKTYFYFSVPNQVLEVRAYPKNKDLRFDIIHSRDFIIIDSLITLDGYSRFKVQFIDLNNSDMLRFTFKVKVDTGYRYEEFHIQPLYRTKAEIRPSSNELFIGEEKTFEIFSNNPNNLNISNEWITSESMDYQLKSERSKIFINLIPKKLGVQMLDAPLTTHNPYLTKDGKLSYQIAPISHGFNVKASRLQFLSLDKNEVAFSDESRVNGEEIQIQNSRFLKLNKTYRIEAQEEAGGALIAELFTKQRLTNNRVLCIIRPYNYHTSSDGYLYIKDGDHPKFITNVSITPRTEIQKILILEKGRDWKPSNVVHPGETVEVKLIGQSLHNANIHFEELIDVTTDTLIKNSTELSFKLKVPIDISKKTLNIYNHKVATGQKLIVKEYQKARDFDYVYMSYGDIARKISAVKGPILYSKIVKDVTFSFSNGKIDEDLLYGKQYLKMDISVTSKDNELIEMKTINNIVVCPSEKSPRHNYYPDNDCSTNNISLNKYLRKATYDLDEWSRINITVENDEQKHGGESQKKELEIIMKRKYSFDLEVSFPAGLLKITPGDTSGDIGTFSGISIGVIGQFSFYHPDKINKYRPYKVGAGFLAINAFNYDADKDSRDVAVVLLGSVYPTNTKAKLSFPIYFGCGFYLKQKEFSFLVGPGVKVSF